MFAWFDIAERGAVGQLFYEELNQTEIGLRFDEAKVVIVDLHALGEGRLWQDRKRLPFVRDEFESTIAQTGHCFWKRAAAIEGEKNTLRFADDLAQDRRDRLEPLRERIVRRHVDAKECSTVFVVHVIVGDSGQDTLVLHPPAAANRALAGIGPQMIVDVVDAARAALTIREEAAKHGEVERHGAKIFGQISHHGAHRWRRRTFSRTEQRRRRWRRDPPYTLDTSLSEGERGSDGIA